MNVWTRVVTDLEKYASEQRSNKSLIMRIINYISKNSCSGDCMQGRSPCNCERRYG